MVRQSLRLVKKNHEAETPRKSAGVAYFEPLDKPYSPRTVATAPPTIIQIDLFAGEPVKMRDTPELKDCAEL